jgi:hypothetical protein
MLEVERKKKNSELQANATQQAISVTTLSTSQYVDSQLLVFYVSLTDVLIVNVIYYLHS